VPASKGSAAVVTDFDSKLETLATSDPKTILDAVQTNLQATVK
jgi:multiple sugar transport system substrate-binding protein